jgi:uncharacterized membrane protein
MLDITIRKQTQITLRRTLLQTSRSKDVPNIGWLLFLFDVCIKTMFGSSLTPVVWSKVHVLFMLFVFVCIWWCQIRLDYMSNIAVSYKRKELFTLRKNMVSPPVYGGVSVAHLVSFLCCVFCFVCLDLRPAYTSNRTKWWTSLYANKHK